MMMMMTTPRHRRAPTNIGNLSWLVFVLFFLRRPATLSLALSSPNTSSTSSSSPSSPSLYGSTTRNIATQVLQGTGPPQVDLNQYNLASLEQIQEEWTVAKVQKVTESQGRVQLSAKSTNDHYADTLLVSFPRSNDSSGGIGIELLELAGGREDGLGITVVQSLVEGGSADGSDLLPGDAIESVSVVRRRKQLDVTTSSSNNNMGDDTTTKAGLAETEEAFSVSTLCLDYDATVEAISSLPPPKTGWEDMYTLKVRRLRRRPKVRVHLQYPPNQDDAPAGGVETIEMYAGENLRQGMLIRGVALNDPLAQRFDTKQGGNCGAGGLCRTCSVVVSSGGDLLNPQRPAEKQMLADQPRWRLACKAILGYGMQAGELTIRVNPRRW